MMGRIEFRILGSPDLRTEDGTAVLSVLAQPKRLALLSFLAVKALGDFTRRDTICASLWPDADQGQARHRLRSALHMLRQALGHEAVARRGDEEIGLAAELVWSDVNAVEQAAAFENHEEVLSLYRGDFLEGFHVDASVDFEEWLRSTRGRLQRTASASATALTRDALAAGDTEAALRWSDRGREIAPLEEGALQDRLRALDAAGRRADAAQEYENYARRLESELEASPSPETAALMEQVRTRTETSGLTSTPPAVSTGASGPMDEAIVQPATSGRAALMTAAVALGGAAFVAARVSQTGAGDGQPPGVSLLAYLASWLILVVGVWFLFERAEETASPSGRARVSAWLRPQERVGTSEGGWAEGFVAAFDRIFGPKHLSLYCFIRSMAVSVIAVTILFLLWIAIRPEQFSAFAAEQGMRGLGEVILITFIVNVVADYLSLLETRGALGLLRRWSGPWARAGVLAFDALATLVVWLVFYAGLPFLLLAGVSGTANDIMLFLQFQVWSYSPTIYEVMGLSANGGGPPVGVWFYSTFVTSIWLWMYLGAGQIARATHLAGGAAGRGLSGFARLFDAERQPFRVLGFVAMLVVTTAYGLGWLINLL